MGDILAGFAWVIVAFAVCISLSESFRSFMFEVIR